MIFILKENLCASKKCGKGYEPKLFGGTKKNIVRKKHAPEWPPTSGQA